jgi:hypothetical protein
MAGVLFVSRSGIKFRRSRWDLNSPFQVASRISERGGVIVSIDAQTIRANRNASLKSQMAGKEEPSCDANEGVTSRK